jgi:hypothetical protein
MPGPTSDIHHRSALVERHWVTAAVPRKDRITDHRRKRIMAQVHDVAAPMLAAAGLTRAACQDYERPGALGVTWTIVVGECATGTVDRHDPYWVYTPRWRHWCAVLTDMVRRENKDRMAHPAAVGHAPR